jgi:hypothetical protein
MTEPSHTVRIDVEIKKINANHVNAVRGAALDRADEGVNVRLRGVSAVSESIVWASGAGSTVLRRVDGSTTWQSSP